MKHKRKLLIPVIILPVLALGTWLFIEVAMPPIERAVEARRFNNLTRADFVQDFDFMVELLKESFPFEEAIYYRHNINIWELAAEVREMLTDPATQINDPYDFFELLRIEFFDPMDGIGHLFALHESAFRGRFSLLLAQANLNDWDQRRRHGLFDDFPVFDLWADVFTQRRVLSFYGEVAAARLRGERVEGSVMHLIETEIIEEGRIAYVALNFLPQHLPWAYGARANRYHAMMQNWHQAIADYDHLIVDIRGISGGWTLAYDVLIVSTLGGQRLSMPIYTYYNLNDNSAPWAEAYIAERYSRGIWHGRPSSQALVGHEFDRRIEHFYRTPYCGTNVIPFEGQIWLLVDDRTAVAAESIAAISQYTNFATLVGETTRGVGIMQNHAYFSLPNSGIVIRYDYSITMDLQGNQFAGRGIVPDYFNRPGMDALETVIAIIGEDTHSITFWE
jgi:hypothetical protein